MGADTNLPRLNELMIKNRTTKKWLALYGVLLLCGPVRAYEGMYEQAPINYSRSEPDGPVAELQRKLNSGAVHLDGAIPDSG